jgi:hypothetical protein
MEQKRPRLNPNLRVMEIRMLDLHDVRQELGRFGKLNAEAAVAPRWRPARRW